MPSRFTLLMTLFLLPLCARSQEHISFKNLTEQEIISKLGNVLNLKFNFNPEVLKEERHTFSVLGNLDAVISRVEEKLSLELLHLENNIYAIRSSNTSSIIKEPSFSFRVLDEFGTELPYCNVILTNLELVFQTDVNGSCTIKGFFSDHEEVNISYLGFQTFQTQLIQLKNSSEVVLQSASHILGEIVIRDFLSSLETNSLGNKETLQEIDIAGISDQDLLKKAQLLPGIHSTSESLNDLQIRGGPPDQVSYKWNDIRLLQTSLFYGKVSGVNPFMADEMTITRNGSSADQSGQASGSILLESSKVIPTKASLKIFSDLLYSNIGISIPLIKNKLSAKAAYRKSNNHLFNSHVYQEYFDQSFQYGLLENDQFYLDFYDVRGQEQITQNFDFNDISANINWRPRKKTELSASFLNIGNRFVYEHYDGLFSEATSRDDFQISNYGWSLEANHSFTPHLSFKGLVNGSRYKNRYLYTKDKTQELGRDQFRENDVNQEQISAELNYARAHFDFTIGAQYENWEVNFIDTTRLPSAGIHYVKNGGSTGEQSAFASALWKFIPNTVIETGIRYSDFGQSLIDRKIIEPRIHVSHALNPSVTLHGHYGKFHQNLNRRLYSSALEVEKGIWYLSDERLESDNFIWAVQNVQTSLGIKYLFKHWKFTVDIYDKKAENIWTSALDFSVEEDPFSFADLKVKGLELSSHYQNKYWRLIWTYELTDETLTVKRNENYDIKSPFTQKHKISLMQSFAKEAWTLSSRWRYNSGRYYSKGKEFYSQTEPFVYYGIDYESILRESISAYHSLDLSIQYKWEIQKEKRRWMEIGFHIQNVYNRKNHVKRQYYVDYTKNPFEMAFYDRRGLGITPNISIRLNL